MSNSFRFMAGMRRLKISPKTGFTGARVSGFSLLILCRSSETHRRGILMTGLLAAGWRAAPARARV